ncbi:MAG: hypothetical protein IPJ26_12940 [Bacteroidetes bacterium]|nr:hypothetical protein [Bacteroidota bacterium]
MLKQFIEESVIHIYGTIGSIFEESSVSKPVAFGAANDKYENWITQNMQLQYDERNRESLKNTFKSQSCISTLQEENSKFENDLCFSDPSDLQVCFFGFAFDYLNCRRLNLAYDK